VAAETAGKNNPPGHICLLLPIFLPISIRMLSNLARKY
jgi:hypothetical protein